jgi:uncharacterized membrane protein
VKGVVFCISLLAGLSIPAAPVFHVVEVGLPQEAESRATDLNDNGVLLGSYAEGTNSFIFTSRNSEVSAFQGPAPVCWPNAINNHDEIVGGYQILITNEWTGLSWIIKPWLHRNGANYLLGNDSSDWSEALDISDDGVVVGYLGFEAYILSDPQTSMMGSWGGAGPLPTYKLCAISETGWIVGNAPGYSGSSSYRWRAFEPASKEYLDQSQFVYGINFHGQSVGSGGFKISARQAALWNGTNVTWLGAPLDWDSDCRGVNDDGFIVGTAYNPSLGANQALRSVAMLWTNNMGIDLNNITSLPDGARLLEAVGVNEQGLIAANMFVQGKNRAVLLQASSEPLLTEPLDFISPLSGIQKTNRVRAALNPSKWPAEIVSIRYELHLRARNYSSVGGDFWRPPWWSSSHYRVETALEPPFEIEFTNLPPGQFALGATITDKRGVTASLPPTFFTVVAPPKLEAIRINMRGSFEFGMNGGAGYQYVLEQSTNLLNWIQITNSFGTMGGNFSDLATNKVANFFRARAIETNSDFYGATFQLHLPPVGLSGRGFRFTKTDNSFGFDLKFQEETVVVSYSYPWEPPATGTYTYTVQNGRSFVHIQFPDDPLWDIHLELDWSGTDFNQWRGYEDYAAQHTEYTGFFQPLYF